MAAAAALPHSVEGLARRATVLQVSLQGSQGNTEGMVTILGSFDHRLSDLEDAMRPTQVRTHAIRMAHENIDKTLKAADGILSQFDLARRAEAAILRGPHEDLESYLEAVDLLKGIVRFFSSNKNFTSSEGVLSHVNNLLAKFAQKIEEGFKQLVSTYSLCSHQGTILRLIERMLATLSIHRKAWRLLYTGLQH